MAETSSPTFKRLRAVAAKLFWDQGYAATTTRELAAVLGVQKASIYYHIRSKEDLLYSLCVESLENIYSATEAAITGVEDPVERVRALIKGHVSAMLADKEKHATMLTELRSLSPKRRREVVGLRDDYEKLVRSVLADAQEAGALRGDIPAKYLELCLLDLMNWAIFWFRPDRGMSPEQLAETFAILFLEGAQDRRVGEEAIRNDRDEEVSGA
jgi:AcrR family transcriptional regulator